MGHQTLHWAAASVFALFLLLGMGLTIGVYELFKNPKQCSNEAPLFEGLVASELASMNRIIISANTGLQKEYALQFSSMNECLSKCEIAFCKGPFFGAPNTMCSRAETGISAQCPSFPRCVNECDKVCSSSGAADPLCFVDPVSICR